MNIEEVMQHENVDFSGVEQSYFLLGLLSAFDNRFQAMADKTLGEITWKQFFTIICINMCREKPTIRELAEILGSSHQNVKQILIKLEKKDFVRITPDEKDKRKQRVELTERCMEFCSQNDDMSIGIVEKLFGGVSEEQLKITIGTIIQIESNLKSMEEYINE